MKKIIIAVLALVMTGACTDKKVQEQKDLPQKGHLIILSGSSCFKTMSPRMEMKCAVI